MTLKNGSENEQENGHFCKRDGMVQFSSHFCLIFKFSFENELENLNEPKMA